MAREPARQGAVGIQSTSGPMGVVFYPRRRVRIDWGRIRIPPKQSSQQAGAGRQMVPAGRPVGWVGGVPMAVHAR